LGNACYYSVLALLFSHLPSRNLKIKIYKTLILPVVLYGYETWSFTLREAQKLRVSENWVLKKYVDIRRRKWQEARKDCMRSLKLPCFTTYYWGDQIMEDETAW
jgi:hypothetical protein